MKWSAPPVLTEAQRERLALAQRLRESADRSEQELRDALSRSYYSIYHVARAWVASERSRVGHLELREKVQGIDPQLAEAIRRLQKLREMADYDPEMVDRDYGGDIESFRRAVNEELGRSRAVYNLIRKKLEDGREK